QPLYKKELASRECPPFIEQLDHARIPLEKYRNVIDLCCQPANYGERNLVFEALEFAYEHHANQVRKSGELYINHPIAVAEIIAGTLGLKDPELIAATILHDIVEDVSFLTTINIEKKFGPNVAAFVDGCTKLQMMSLDSSVNKDMTYQKLALMASEHPEILLIKFADRIHNMQTIRSLEEHKRQRIAQETIEIYGPLAEKLGLFSFKRILFDLAIRQRFPKKSKKMLSALHSEKTSVRINEIKEMLENRFKIFPFDVQVTSRLKNLYAFYSPKTKSLDMNNAENFVDFTIIMDTDDILHCYTAMGMVNSAFSLVPKTIRDYISNPKTNGYRSLHMRIGHKESRYLIKIRTREMENIARKGLLLHWDDPENTMEYRKAISDILKNIGEYQGSPVNRKDMFRHLTEDDKIFVYTPKRDMQYLPAGSIVLDFAYKIHSNLGDRCDYARVNNRTVSRAHVLNDGDIVEIVTSGKPVEISAYMEGKCKTPKARSAVNRQLQKKRDLFAGQIGKTIMLQAMEPHGFTEELFKSNAMSYFLTYKGYEDIDQLFTNVGQSLVMPREVLWEIADIPPEIRKIKPFDKREERVKENLCPSSAKAKGNRHLSKGREKEYAGKTYNERFLLTISDIERDVHKFSQCCNPLPGIDFCLALLNRDGVSLHRECCEKYKEDREYTLNKIQIMDVIWNMDFIWKESLTFNITAYGINIRDAIKRISDISIPADLHFVRRSHLGNGIEISVSFQKFNEAREFFSSFEKKNCQIQIQDYGRHEFMTGGQWQLAKQ
ncbi:MAG: bifunctional (p)ppGpp synthetase/guanosine-3',5'-bis(diphosphate) 3'-pyrophosphohydrolase, partial [Desulfamplus sp.]|nr:bifunctional (p)ppGpp synthetase/guanosine-3',5'-bis(diphosphate) 3'-pyrophosphohydrolase [Desulfamplus sp.]